MIVDFHTHIFPPWLREKRQALLHQDATLAQLYAHSRARMATAEELLAHMDKAGISLSVALGIGWTDVDLARRVNDYILEAAQRYPQRIVGFCAVNPRWGPVALKEVERCARAGAKGIGELHPHTQAFDPGDLQLMGPLVEIARKYGLILLTHSSEPLGHHYPGKGDTTPQVLYTFLRNFPGLPVVCAHWGGGLPFYALMPEVAEALKTTYFDTAASPLLYKAAVFQTVAQLVGSHRILLGTDYPLLRPERVLQQLKEAPLSGEEKADILGRNAIRLLGLKETL